MRRAAASLAFLLLIVMAGSELASAQDVSEDQELPRAIEKVQEAKKLYLDAATGKLQNVYGREEAARLWTLDRCMQELVCAAIRQKESDATVRKATNAVVFWQEWPEAFHYEQDETKVDNRLTREPEWAGPEALTVFVLRKELADDGVMYVLQNSLPWPKRDWRIRPSLYVVLRQGKETQLHQLHRREITELTYGNGVKMFLLGTVAIPGETYPVVAAFEGPEADMRVASLILSGYDPQSQSWVTKGGGDMPDFEQVWDFEYKPDHSKLILTLPPDADRPENELDAPWPTKEIDLQAKGMEFLRNLKTQPGN